MKTKSIKQSITFHTKPHNIYELLIDSDKHSRLTGEKAHISREIGGKFSTFDGYSEGINLDLIPDKKIVQSWRASDWPKGHYSKVIFLMDKDEDDTLLTFTQSGIPADQYEDISQGWYDYYWEPMKHLLEKTI